MFDFYHAVSSTTSLPAGGGLSCSFMALSLSSLVESLARDEIKRGVISVTEIVSLNLSYRHRSESALDDPLFA